MDDLLSLLPFLIIYLIAASSSSKKKKRNPRRQTPMRTAAEGEQIDLRRILRDRSTSKGFGEAFGKEAGSAAQKEAAKDTAHDAVCSEQPIHLHAVSAGQMAAAGEGEDPCHAGGVRMQEEETAYDAVQTGQDLGQDVLRGVIMSEILLRPQERNALRAMRKGTYGSGNQSHHCG